MVWLVLWFVLFSLSTIYVIFLKVRNYYLIHEIKEMEESIILLDASIQKRKIEIMNKQQQLDDLRSGVIGSE